jgi:probable HAF family extracellular repeat protein
MKGFVWDSVNGRQDGFPELYCINDHGLAAGISWVLDLITGESYYIPPAPSSETANAYAINNLGQAAGLFWGGGLRSFIWDKVNGADSIGDGIWAWDINDSGQVVGEGSADNPNLTGYTAFIWDRLNGVRSIGALQEGLESRAYGINNLGQVVGTSQFAASNYARHAFLWDEGNGMQDLGTLGYSPPESDVSEARDINIHGQVVGGSVGSSGEGSGWVGFIWDSTNGMQDLNHLIPWYRSKVLARL